ncbi:MAG: phage integrase N-terminal SAM-like domain-containing protein, partial [Burkholderiales bacterium]
SKPNMEAGMDAASESDAKAPRLLDLVRDVIARKHYSRRTEEAYVNWIKRFIFFSEKRHPSDMGAPEVTSFLSHLARDRDVAAATQNQALAAILFLYKEALKIQRLLAHMNGTKWLMVSLLYGAGLRLRECLKLRVKDIDFDYRQILVRDGKGGKDLVTMLPGPVIEPLRKHLLQVRSLHERGVASPLDALSRP